MLRKGVLVVALVAVASILSGCFWTADNAGGGGIALKIDASEIGGSGVGASQMVGSQESPSDGFVIAFVIADDLLRGDPAVAVRAIDELESVINNAIAQVFVAQMETRFNGNSSVDFSDLDVESAFPAIQSQTKALSGTSGSNTFRDLKADREYLVVVFGVARIGDGNGTIAGLGFTTTTIESGETKTVSLSLEENRDSFKKFIADNYDLTDPPGVRVNLVPVGKLSDLPKTLYYDVVKLNDDNQEMKLSEYYSFDEGSREYGDLYVADTLGSDTIKLSGYTSQPNNGTLVGERKPLPSNNRIEGVERGERIQLIITDQKERGLAPSDTERFVIGVSDSFVFDNEQDVVIRMYEWVAGEYDPTDSSGVRVNLIRKEELNGLPTSLYYDVINLNEGAPEDIIAKYYGNEELYVVNYNTNWGDDSNDASNIPLSKYANDPHDGKLVGERKPLPSNYRIEITGVKRGDSIRLIITDQAERTSAPSGTDHFVIGVSDSFVFGNEPVVNIGMYKWVAEE